MPVNGVSAVIAEMFNIIWPPIQATIPRDRIRENWSGAFCTILNALYKKNANNKIKTNEPINPSSSAIAANIESVEA